MSWWGEHVVSRVIEASLPQPPVIRMRAQVCEGLTGRVLQVGFGSGLDLPCLPPDVVRLDAVEPSDLAWRRSAARRGRCRAEVERVGLDGQRLAVADATYDAALVTSSLCTIPDPAAALGEIRRTLRPGGLLHYLEHGYLLGGVGRPWSYLSWGRAVRALIHVTR